MMMLMAATSMALRTWHISITSSSVMGATLVPVGVVSSRPLAVSSSIASRMGERLMSSSCSRAWSDTGIPGASSKLMILSLI